MRFATSVCNTAQSLYLAYPALGSRRLSGERAWAGALPSRLLFPSAASVDRRKRQPARRPHPPPAARHRARHVSPVPRHSLLRLHPFTTSALAPTLLSACAPPAEGPWAPTWPRRHQWQNRASRLPRPLSAPPPRGRRGGPGMSRALSRCAGCACFAACCVSACARSGGWGECRRNAVEAAEASSSTGRRERRGCQGRPGWGKDCFPGKGRKWVSRAAPTALSGEVRKNCSRLSHFMVISLEPPHKLRHVRNISNYCVVAAHGAVMIIS